VIAAAEPEFAFDPRGHLTGATPREQTESHRLIEHLMIAANEQVATLLADRSVPALYRVHERPGPEAVERLAGQLASLEVPTPPLPEQLTPQQAADAVAAISREVDAHVRRVGRGRAALTSLVLRSLKQAYYTPENRGHAGLGSQRYCHFTSPIRRYPDLVCHRALLSAVGGGEDAPRASTLEEAGAWSSSRERDAMAIERTADDVARCFLLERELYEHGWEQGFEGEVIGVIGAGAFVAFGDGYEGLLPVRRLRGDTPTTGSAGGARAHDWWELNEHGTILFGTRSGDALRLGDPVSVVVRGVDPPRGRVDLDVAAG
jgi:ribonuclease R